jgi:hypothetical protein
MIRISPKLFSDVILGSKPAVINALQRAIQLEHATIPAYLYALYSNKPGPHGAPGPNSAIAAILQSIIKEEMLHMALACNVINALGGEPKIDDPKFVPVYPGPLPGAVATGLQVGLEPLSLDLVNRVFMVIEKPEDPLDFPSSRNEDLEEPKTIGEFYTAIKNRIRKLGDSAFTGDPKRQVTGMFKDLVAVTNVETASKAIDVIIVQGEGTTLSPVDPDGDYAHYYRLSEIWNGKKLKKNPHALPGSPPDQQYFYGGAPVPFDPNAIFKAPTNPKLSDYKGGSAARRAVDNFNYTYTSLLRTLHAMFNGQPDLYGQSFSVMMSLRQQATDMMSGTNLPGPVGPTFNYQPVNPSTL